MDARRADVLAAIDQERDYQVNKWGTAFDDNQNTPNDFVSYISHYSTKWFNGGFAPYDAETVAKFKQSMIKVAAIAAAAVESLERQVYNNGKPFYEVE